MTGICFQPICGWKRWMETSQTRLELKLVMSHVGLYSTASAMIPSLCDKGAQLSTARSTDLYSEGAQHSVAREYSITQQRNTALHSEGVQISMEREHSSPWQGSTAFHSKGALHSTAREHCIPWQGSTVFHSKGAQISTVKRTRFSAL